MSIFLEGAFLFVNVGDVCYSGYDYYVDYLCSVAVYG